MASIASTRMRSTTMLLCNSFTFAFGLLFAWAALYKATWPSDSVRFAGLFLPTDQASLAVKVLTAAELTIGSVLLFGTSSRAVMLIALSLIVVFSSALLYAKISGYTEACGCVGIGTTVSHALVRNAILAAAACAAIWVPTARSTELQGAASRRNVRFSVERQRLWPCPLQRLPLLTESLP